MPVSAQASRTVARHRQKIEDLIAAMTVEEKAGQLNLLADPFRWMPTAVNPLDGTGDPARVTALIRLHGIRLWARRLPIQPRTPHPQEHVR